MFWVVYILRSEDNRIYTGCTSNLKERLAKHNNGYVPATKSLIPLELVSYFVFTNKYTAFSFEKYLKSGSGRAFIKKHNLTGKPLKESNRT